MSSPIRTRFAAIVAACALTFSVVVATAAPASAAKVSCSISTTKTVRYGDTGSCVELLQQRIGGVSVDGHFGSKTNYAVQQFQRANGLAVDGIVGTQTWNRIRQGLPRQGSVTYAGTGSHAGVTVYACHLSSRTGVRFAVRNKTSVRFRDVVLEQVDWQGYGMIIAEGIGSGATVSGGGWALGATESFRRVNVRLSNGSERSVNRTFSFVRDRLPDCR